MIKIIASRSEAIKNGKNYLRAELIADSASELSVEGMSNYHFTFGSIAYCIAEKFFYVLNSSGTWVSSSEDGENVTPNRALNSTLNRPVNLTSTKTVTLSPDVTESDTSNSEGITDDVKEVEKVNEVTEDAELIRDPEGE